MTRHSPTRPDTTVDLFERSLDVIHAGQAPTGAFIASPTFGQYDYAWLRDGSFVAEALDLVGDLTAAARFHGWVASIVNDARAGIERSIAAVVAGSTPRAADYIHCRYRTDGSRGPEDWPTFQLDGPGIWLWSLGQHARCGGTIDNDLLVAAGLVSRYLAALWDHPSNDAWEESPDHVHSSTLAGILAGLRAARNLGIDARADPAVIAAEAGLVHRVIGRNGALTKWPGNDAVDGSLLWIAAPYGLLDPTSPAFAATLVRVEEDLVSVDGGVHRYRDDTYYGGGEWPLLTSALGRVYLRRGGPGDRDRATRCLAWIEAQAEPDGALPEQVATRALHPERIAEWIAAWGPSASPLLWSHAAYLALRSELR